MKSIWTYFIFTATLAYIGTRLDLSSLDISSTYAIYIRSFTAVPLFLFTGYILAHTKRNLSINAASILSLLICSGLTLNHLNSSHNVAKMYHKLYKNFNLQPQVQTDLQILALKNPDNEKRLNAAKIIYNNTGRHIYYQDESNSTLKFNPTDDDLRTSETMKELKNKSLPLLADLKEINSSYKMVIYILFIFLLISYGISKYRFSLKKRPRSV